MIRVFHPIVVITISVLMKGANCVRAQVTHPAGFCRFFLPEKRRARVRINRLRISGSLAFFLAHYRSKRCFCQEILMATRSNFNAGLHALTDAAAEVEPSRGGQVRDTPPPSGKPSLPDGDRRHGGTPPHDTSDVRDIHPPDDLPRPENGHSGEGPEARE